MVAAGDPVESADVTTIEDYTSGRPLVRLIAQSAQSITDNTNTAITFGASSEDIDTHGYHDTASNTSRITPTNGVAAYWRVTALAWMASNSTTTDLFVGIYKNGGIHTINRVKPDNTVSDAPSVQVTAIVALNGTTDYVEMYVNNDDSGGSARNTATGSGTNCVLEAEFLRPQ
jgi:hypothetical protein